MRRASDPNWRRAALGVLALLLVLLLIAIAWLPLIALYYQFFRHFLKF